ncbi:uncharacterized protein FIBRA_02503 [Fibroporia radiculosa]|uniref:Uncharacterized protein n=1 Tax=Fibroporia radiculosa TaxID=599839 RepID=J4GMX2_9APHY|nr:uncharacterized protein FIBRA_02503 [Fibroporia radiculosa]CCM00470.1 predicted protein [Fibroporia radiculosa]
MLKGTDALSEEDRTAAAWTLIGFAQRKLIYRYRLQVELTRIQRLAIADDRLMFTYSARREAGRDLEDELVASHMRMAYSMQRNCEYMRSGYPSEPHLAEAAAQQLAISRKGFGYPLTGILRDNLDGGLIDLRERGEVVWRALLTMAYDSAAESEQPNVPPITTAQAARLTDL